MFLQILDGIIALLKTLLVPRGSQLLLTAALLLPAVQYLFTVFIRISNMHKKCSIQHEHLDRKTMVTSLSER